MSKKLGILSKNKLSSKAEHASRNRQPNQNNNLPDWVGHPPSTELTDEELLDFYLSLPKEQRDENFVETAGAAEIVGLSQRTIQWWIEIGAIRAIFLGGKYKVCLTSLKEYLRSRVEGQAD